MNVSIHPELEQLDRGEGTPWDVEEIKAAGREAEYERALLTGWRSCDML